MRFYEMRLKCRNDWFYIKQNNNAITDQIGIYIIYNLENTNINYQLLSQVLQDELSYAENSN